MVLVFQQIVLSVRSSLISIVNFSATGKLLNGETEHSRGPLDDCAFLWKLIIKTVEETSWKQLSVSIKFAHDGLVSIKFAVSICQFGWKTNKIKFGVISSPSSSGTNGAMTTLHGSTTKHNENGPWAMIDRVLYCTFVNTSQMHTFFFLHFGIYF